MHACVKWDVMAMKRNHMRACTKFVSVGNRLSKVKVYRPVELTSSLDLRGHLQNPTSIFPQALIQYLYECTQGPSRQVQHDNVVESK